MRANPSRWRKRRSSGKLRRAILAALRDDAGITSQDLASMIGKRWGPVCIALDDLLIRGEVERDENGYRRGTVMTQELHRVYRQRIAASVAAAKAGANVVLRVRPSPDGWGHQLGWAMGAGLRVIASGDKIAMDALLPLASEEFARQLAETAEPELVAR